jgi:aminoglycoside 6'-N-acetyltransferase
MMSEVPDHPVQPTNPAAVVLRPAVLADAPLLRSWESAPHLAGHLGDDDWQWEQALRAPHASREPFIAESNGRPIGFVEILNPSLDPERYWGDAPAGLRAIDIWIGEPDAVGRGHGSAMMRQALGRCFAAPEVTAVMVDPLAGNIDAHRFYARLGFRPVERRRFGDDDTLVMRLERHEWETPRQAALPATRGSGPPHPPSG